MRDIKFRAWDSKNNKWLTAVPSLEYLLDDEDACVSHHDYDDEDAIYFYPHNPLPYNFKGRIIYQQFTGLKDKNGVDIYEGDIVKQYDGKRYSVVEWVSESDGWDFTGWRTKNATWGDGIEGTEIIGNIFENPDTQI